MGHHRRGSSGNRFVEPVLVRQCDVEEPEMPSTHMSAAVAGDRSRDIRASRRCRRSKVAVDPMMAEGGIQGGSVSFSEMTELPPLKEVYIAPPPPPVAPAPVTLQRLPCFKVGERPTKPKVQPREVAEKAIEDQERSSKADAVPIAGAVLILIIGIAVTFYVHSLNGDIDPDAGPSGDATRSTAGTEPAVRAQPAPTPAPAPSGVTGEGTSSDSRR
jgi:hypothetical protein